jgi:hypothetical protein
MHPINLVILINTTVDLPIIIIFGPLVDNERIVAMKVKLEGDLGFI